MTAPAPPPEPSGAELRDRYPALQGAQLWHGCYSRMLYAIVPGVRRLAGAPEEHADDFARRLADAVTARRPEPAAARPRPAEEVPGPTGGRPDPWPFINDPDPDMRNMRPGFQT